MARKLYETEKHRQDEKKLADAWGIKFKCKCSKLPYSYFLDFVCERDGKIVHILEVRRRNKKMANLNTHMIGMWKVTHARQLSDTLGVPCYLLFQYDDGCCYIDMEVAPDYYNRWGRMTKENNRGDAADVEIMAHWSKDKFTNL